MDAFASAVPWLANVLVVFGVFLMTIGVYGVVRMPDTYTRLHATSKAVVLGVVPLLVASAMIGDKGVVLRVGLIAVFLLLTTPVSAHVIGRAAYMRGEKMQAPEPIDEAQSDPAAHRGGVL